MSVVISLNNISKQYRLGNVGTGTISNDLNRWWYKVRGKEDPYLKIGEENDRSKKADSDYVWVLNNINVEVKQGEVLGIIGKNGAGKSTLLKILSRVTSPTLGEIKVKGRIASLLEVGTGFHPELTGRENVFLNGAILGMTKTEIRSKFDEIVAFSGVERYIDTPAKRYSSGMYVRLAFAVAAHLESEILIVDEVLSVGDTEFQNKCLGKMKDINGQGRTVLFVSHNMSAVRDLCSRAILLEHGKLKKEGGVSEIIDYYFKGDSDMNQSGIVPDDYVRLWGSGEVKIKQVLIVDDNNEPVSNVFFRQRIKIVIKHDAHKEVNDVLWSLRIATTDGSIIGISDTFSKFNEGFIIKKGLGQTTLYLNTAFMPGDYTLNVGISKTNGGSIDYIERIYDFRVLRTSKNENEHYKWTKPDGFLELDVDWELNKSK